MFLLPFLPNWLFEGPRTVKHRPRRHICGDCNAPWTGDHVCAPELVQADPPGGPLRGELRRIDPAEELEPMAHPRAAELERRPRVRISR